jgi:hypothetical protein
MRRIALAVFAFVLGCASSHHRRSRQPAADNGCINDRVMSVRDSLKEKLGNQAGYSGIGVGTMCDPQDMAKYAGIKTSNAPSKPVCGVQVVFDTEAHLREFAKQYYQLASAPNAVALCPSIR